MFPVFVLETGGIETKVTSPSSKQGVQNQKECLPGQAEK